MKWHDIEQNTEEWENLRLGKITASKAASFMANGEDAFGEPAKCYALQLALEIETGQKCFESFSNVHTQRGHAQEPIARTAYECENFLTVEKGGFFDCGDYGASPDGLIDDIGLIEIKSVIAHVHFNNIKRSSFDPAYKWQLASLLDCSGRKWVDFVSFCSVYPEHKKLFTCRVQRSALKEEIKLLRNKRNKFIKLVSCMRNELT